MSSSSELPHGWTQETDQASGKAYYVHDATQWITFTRPLGLTSIPSPFLTSLQPQPAPSSSSTSIPASPPPPYQTLSPREQRSSRAGSTSDSSPAQAKSSIPVYQQNNQSPSSSRMPSLPTFLPLHAPIRVQPASSRRRSSVTFADAERALLSSPVASSRRQSMSPPPSSTARSQTSGATTQSSIPSNTQPIRGILRRSSTARDHREDQDDDMMRTISDQLDNVRLYGNARPPSAHPTSIHSPPLGDLSYSMSPRRFSSGSNEPVVVEEEGEDSDIDNASVFSFDTDVMAARLRGQALADQEATRISREEDDASRIREAMRGDQLRDARKRERARARLREAERRREEDLVRRLALEEEILARKEKEKTKYTNAIRKEEMRRAEEVSIMSELGDLSDYEFLKLKQELARDGLLSLPTANDRIGFSYDQTPGIPLFDSLSSSPFGMHDLSQGLPSGSLSSFSPIGRRRSSLSSFSSDSSYRHQFDYPYHFPSSSLPSSSSGFFPTSGHLGPDLTSGTGRSLYSPYYAGIQDPGPLDYI